MQRAVAPAAQIICLYGSCFKKSADTAITLLVRDQVSFLDEKFLADRQAAESGETLNFFMFGKYNQGQCGYCKNSQLRHNQIPAAGLPAENSY